MAIGKIITGQTFGNWLNTTNLLVDEINQATDKYSQGKLVRWGAGGVITVNALTSSSLKLAGSNNTVNAISSDWSTPIDDFTLMTSNAVHHSILNADTIRLIHPTRVTSDITANTIALIAAGQKHIDVSQTGVNFYSNVTFHESMTVLGTRTELNVVTMEVEDSNIHLNIGSNASPTTATNAGFDIGWTNAFMRLVSTGTEFPVEKTGVITLNPVYKSLDLDLGSGPINKGAVDMNDKDRLVLTYVKPDPVAFINPTYNIYGTNFYDANDFVLGVGTISDVLDYPFAYELAVPPAPQYNREGGVLNPQSYNGEILYDINGTTYDNYADYKSAFANAAVGATVTISFDPKSHRQLYYWMGEANLKNYPETEVNYQTTGGGVQLTKIDNPIGSPLEDNPTFEVYAGETINFWLNLQNNNTNPFFIGTTPYTDPLRRTDTDRIQMGTGGGISSQIAAEYEIDGTPYDKPLITAYETAFTSSTSLRANVTFRATQPGTYYYWATGNSADPNFQMGGEIRVFPRQLNMGGPITVARRLGKILEKSVTYDDTINTQWFEIDGIPKDKIELEAGDSVKFNIENVNHSDNVFVISTSTSTAGALNFNLHNVLYQADGVSEYKVWTDYENDFAGNAFSNVIFTPFDNGLPYPQTYYYFANNNPTDYGVIEVLQPRPFNLDAFHISTDNATATIENPIKFSVTKNQYPTMELDGELADFIGTRNGIRLPNNSYDYTPNSNGIIRYNDQLNLFEGYTQGQWRGLGGVIDLNQDTFVETDDFNDTIYFTANNANVSQMREDRMFFETNREEIVPGLSHKVSNIREESNETTLQYNVHVDGSANTFDGIGWNLETGKTGIKIDHRGVDIDSSGYLKLPYGEFYERPYNSANGMMRMVANGLSVVDSTGNTENFDILELHVGGKWQPLSFIDNEYTYSVSAVSNTVPFHNLYTPFKKEEIEVHVNGLKIERTDFDILSLPNNVYQFTETYISSPGDYTYTGITSLDAGDKLTINYDIVGPTSNVDPILLGVADPLNPGSYLPTSGVEYYVDGVLATSYSNYLGLVANTDISTTNTVSIVYTSSLPGSYYLYTNNNFANNLVNGLTTGTLINVTGRTSYTSNLVFQTNRNPGQIVNVKHKPGRDIGVNRIDVISRSELMNGLATNVRFSGQVTVGAYQPSTSTTTGALVVLGGLGMSGDLFVGKSVTELSAADLKTNITGIDSALDKVVAMKGVEFNWKDDVQENNKEYGLIAEDVAKIAPSLVSFADQKPQGVKYSKVVALLIEAMKQQQEEINLLKSQLPKKRGRKSNSTKE